MRRRTFLQSGVAAVGGIAGLSLDPEAAESQPAGESGLKALAIPADSYTAPDWLRYSRTVNFEGYVPPIYAHMKDFDARKVVDGVVRVGGDTLRFSAVTYFAYYPSRAFPVHEELGNRDLVDEVSQECRRQKIRLYAYTILGAYFAEWGWVDRHPEYANWLLRGPDGKPYAHSHHCGWPGQYHVCIQGSAYRAAMRQVVRELCEHDVEGVYFDGPCGYRGICFCDDCRSGYKKFSGMDLERLAGYVRKYSSAALPPILGVVPPDADLEALTAWFDWANLLVNEDLLDFRQIIHSSGKFMLCHNGSTWRGGTALYEQYRIPEGFMVEHIPQTYQRLVTGMMGASMARPYKKLVQMYLGGYTTEMAGEPAHEHPWAVHNANQEDSDEVRMEGLADLACGNAPLYCTSNRLYYRFGSGSEEPVTEVFHLMGRMEPILKDSVPVPYVTIVPTYESLQLWRSRRQSWNVMMTEGFALAMLDERISFDVNVGTEMTEKWLERQRVIALCGASGVTDAQAMMLGEWVKRGGNLLATYDAGLYDGMGRLRKDGGALREILGVDLKGEAPDSLPECYYRIQQAHPALGEYGVGAMIQGDGQLVPVEVRDGTTVLADCWCLGYGESRGPAIVAHTYGQGRTLYVAGSLEAHYTASRVASLQRVLGAMVRYLGGGKPQPFTLSAPRGVYGVLRQSSNGDYLLWVLANVGFKDAAAGRMRQEFVPVANVAIGIRVPKGRHAKAVHLIRAGRDLAFKEEDGYAKATIPAVHIGEAVHLELV